jgi:hypothetical protein
MFRFALVSVDGESLGRLALRRRDFKPGDLIPSGVGRWLRVVDVIERDREGRLSVLVVEVAAGSAERRPV